MASKQLTPSSVYVRIRPATRTGDCGHTDGEAVSKKVVGWDATSVIVQDDDRHVKSRHEVTGVVGPEVEQEEAFDTMLPALLDGFKTDTNVLFFAYGQTGSGKTHTMLGEIDSLSSAEPVPGWGIFPRVVHSTLQSMQGWRADGVQSVLLASAVEFYCCGAFDLNSEANAKNEVTIDREANVFGMKSKEITSAKQLRRWVTRMYRRRTTAKTKMNDASSRSHCAFILTLHKLSADNMYTKTTFSLIDMAGSERADKTGGERMSGVQAGFEAMKLLEEGTPEKLSVGAQGIFINIELSSIATEILKASDMHKKGLPYKAQKELSTAASFYFCACCDGRALLGACVTISQSPQHGFESWFSLQYAEQLAACRVPLKPVKSVPMTRAFQSALEAAEVAADKFARWGEHPSPQGAKQWRVFSLQTGAATHTAETVLYLRKLMDARDGVAQGVEADLADESGDDEDPPSAVVKAHKVRHLLKKSAIESGTVNDNFSVFIRIRPLIDREIKGGAKNCFAVTDVDFPRDPPPQRITVKPAGTSAGSSYVFDRVFCDSQGQDEVYRAVALPYVAEFLSGTNVTIFAYGQTGTGKTYTIAGPSSDPGLVNRCLHDVFEGLPIAGRELYYEYVQLYLDDLKDLLEESNAELKIMEGKDGAVHVQNLTSRKASSVEEVLEALALGATRRATRAQDMNEVSSRSHAILILRLVEPGGDPSKAAASMFIVDLAGSERIAKSGVTGQGLDEAMSINQSLSALGRVVVTLLDNQCSGQVFVPYNGHPLTMLLKPGLGGNSKTALIACVTQATDSISESVNTLRFAMQATHVKNTVEMKEAQVKRELEREKIESAGHTLVLNGGHGMVELPTGPLEVWGSWEAEGATSGRVVILLCDLKSEPSSLQGILDALVARRCQVLAPKLPGTAEKDLEVDVRVLIHLLDHLGLAQPVFYGRDWGGVRACKLKMCHPKRAGHLVLENFTDKIDERTYKERMKTGAAACQFGGSFMWFFDGTLPSKMDAPPGKNMEGFKGKVDFLYPFCTYKGKHDPQGRSGTIKVAEMFARCVRTKPIDSYLMGDEDVAAQIASRLTP